MLLHKKIEITESHPISSELVEKTLENQVKSFHKKFNNHLHIVWLKNENGDLTAHWTTQD